MSLRARAIATVVCGTAVLGLSDRLPRGEPGSAERTPMKPGCRPRVGRGVSSQAGDAGFENYLPSFFQVDDHRPFAEAAGKVRQV